MYKDSVVVSFSFGKSKIAPVKAKLIIPKLKLVAACLLVRIVHSVVKESPIPVSRTVYWVGAMSVLLLIRNTSRRFSVFVANRLSLIHDFSSVAE